MGKKNKLKNKHSKITSIAITNTTKYKVNFRSKKKKKPNRRPITKYNRVVFYGDLCKRCTECIFKNTHLPLRDIGRPKKDDERIGVSYKNHNNSKLNNNHNKSYDIKDDSSNIRNNLFQKGIYDNNLHHSKIKRNSFYFNNRKNTNNTTCYKK